MIPTIRPSLVKLTSDHYSVPKGTLGLVESVHGEPPEQILSISWQDEHGTSANVAAHDVDLVGVLNVRTHPNREILLGSTLKAISGFATVLESAPIMNLEFTIEGLKMLAERLREEIGKEAHND